LPGSYARDVSYPLVVLGASLSIAFVVLARETVAGVEPGERSPASGTCGGRRSPRRRTAYSDVLEDYGGGRGRVPIHGRSGAVLADPLGSARSHAASASTTPEWCGRRDVPPRAFPS
jgi:hypothetical protein